MSNISMQSLGDIFSDLDKRIDLLKGGIDIVEVGIPVDSVDKDFKMEEQLLSRIERNIIYFKKEAIPRIELALKELNDIAALGISVIKSARYFHDIDNENEELKQEAYSNIKGELDFYISKLIGLKDSLEMEGYGEEKRYTISLPDDFKFPEIQALYPTTDIALSREQSALLFYYLMERNIILNYDDKSISRIISILTGYSAESLRQKDFGKIHDIKNKVPKQPKSSGKSKSNLEILKDALTAVIQEIDKETKLNPPRK